MSRSWAIQGIVQERPRRPERGLFDDYDGEDVYHPNAQGTGQINEMLINLADGKRVILVGINPDPGDTDKEIAREFKRAAKQALACWTKVNWKRAGLEMAKRKKKVKS